MLARFAYALLFALLMVGPAGADVLVAYVGRAEPPKPQLSFLDLVVRDEGLAGARLAIADSEVTARFTNRHIRLSETMLAAQDGMESEIPALAKQQAVAFVAALPPQDLLKLAAAVSPRPVINISARDDALRREQCRANILHTIPSHAMLADGLAQYLALKGWTRWALVIGPAAEDRLLAAAFRQSATKFGSEIVDEKDWTLKLGQGRADSGHVALQTEIPVFTRLADHDVLVVADTGASFGDYLPYRTASPRPVAGTQGLTASGWSPVLDQWGAAQLQERFLKQSGRPMTERDYAGWLAITAIAEAANRTGASDAAALFSYLTGDQFQLAGFKGEALSFRAWDGQMRQPILLAGSRLLVSVSPQPGFLQKGSDLDSLGDAAEENRCAR